MFLSYAQNFEDVILWRALKHVRAGTYIDIGAQDPTEDSVSLGFYEQGWRGLHIEPNADFAGRLRATRPDETVVQAAVGSSDGELRFFEIEGTGLSTGKHEIAEEHRAKGRTVHETRVPTVSLASILDGFEGRDIHWLKIDVEGMEAEVIASWGDSPARPWLVVVEATHPMTSGRVAGAWLNDLTSRGYSEVYFDGLNIFFVSERHTELAEHFGPGPHIFDDFSVTARSRQARHVAAQLEASNAQISSKERELDDALDRASAKLKDTRDRALAERTALEADLHAASNRLLALGQENADLAQRLQDVLASRSWRLTRPMRGLVIGGRRAASAVRAVWGSPMIRRKIRTAGATFASDPRLFASLARGNASKLARKARTVSKVLVTEPRLIPDLVRRSLSGRPPADPPEVVADDTDALHDRMTRYLVREDARHDGRHDEERLAR